MNYPLLKKPTYIIISSLFLCFAQVCCSGKIKTENRKAKEIKEVIGEEFLLPHDGVWRIFERDTVVHIGNNPKLVIYFDGNGCTPCALKELRHWKTVLESVNQLKLNSYVEKFRR